ncbi:MAG: M60 family metallopeptidase [Planctomycetaceae bacterium]
MRKIIAGIAIVGLHVIVASCSAATPPRELFEGVDTVTVPGVVGGVVAFGPKAFAVVSGEVDDFRLPIIAAGLYQRGRIVACGHNGYLSAATLQHSSTGKLISNLMLWAANVKATNVGKLKIAVLDDRKLAEALQKSGLSAQVLSGPSWTSNLTGVQLLLASPRKMAPTDVDAVLRYVQKGGGVIMADAGWVWEGYNAKPGQKLSHDFVGNQIGRAAGLMWSSRNVNTPESKTLAVTPTGLDDLTAHGALSRLQDWPAQGGDFKAVRQAVATLDLTLTLLPTDDKLFRPQLEQLLANRGKGISIPRPRAGIRQADVFARLQVANETRKVLDASIDQLKAHPMAAVFPSQPPESAKAVNKTLSIDTSHPRWHSTGLYARAGDKIDVRVPASAVQSGLSLRIGPHKDKLWEKDQWLRAPEITRQFLLTQETTTVGSGFGGLIYVDVPRDCALGTIDVEVRNAVPAPLYLHGETTQAEWKQTRSAPAPWAELASSKFIITLPAEAVRQLDRPDELMDYWDRVLDACADLAAVPRERQSPERFVIDVQISAGYMHSGYPIMAPLNLAEEVTDLATLQKKGNWGVYHEIGHNHQQQDWTWDGLTEVTVNLFSLYCLEHLNPGAPLHNSIQPNKLAEMTTEFDRTGQLEGPWAQLMPYIQLQRQFGWEPFQKVFAEYRALPDQERPRTTQARKDEWLVRFSQAVGKNLGPFYDSWKINMSPAAKQKVSHLPEWQPVRF